MSQNFNRLVQVLDRYKWKYLLSIILLLIALSARVLEPKILQIAVDQIIASKSSEVTQAKASQDVVAHLLSALLPNSVSLSTVLLLLAVGYVLISILRGSFLFTAMALKTFCGEHAAKNLIDKAFDKIQRLPMAYFSGISKGELIQRCTGDIDTIKRFVENQVITVIQLSAIFILAFMMMFLVDWRYALISVALTPILFISGLMFFKREGKIWLEHEEEADKLNTMVQENLNGIRVVGAFANEEFEKKKFADQNFRKRSIGFRHELLHAIYWPSTDFLVFLQISIAVLAGGYFTLTRQITLGELLSFYTYVSMVAWPMRQLGQVLSEMGMATVAMGRVSEIMQAEDEKDEGILSPDNLLGKIEFRQVSFKYKESDEEYVLKNISFTIQAGEKFAIIGPTGAGKSTIIKLLLRLYDPQEGDILLDEIPIRQYSKKFVRQHIGVALQKPFLFSTTIRENIAYTNPEAEDTQVLKVAKIAQAHEMQEIFPQGFETLVGEKGVTLSGGQKQRVAMARTLLPEPEIVVLDDTTSAVDTETEFGILNALNQENNQKTMIIISHRVTSVQYADEILVLENGTILQSGKPDELLAEEGYYHQIHQIQASVEEEISKDMASLQSKN
ncbi:MAG: ABC transporter ATP-binding protein [Microscillaceae bacterium]|nr:ABC transporter ATP-binding protein [Microscillaceae bacterium]